MINFSTESIDNILSNNLKSADTLLDGYVVVINGKIFVRDCGKFLFKTIDEAKRAFYADARWRVARYCGRQMGNYSDWSSGSSTTNWKNFRQTCNIQIKKLV